MPLIRLLEYIADNSKLYKSVLVYRRITNFSERLLTLLSELIAARIEETGSRIPGTLTATIQKDIAIGYGSSALIGVIISWLKNDMPYSPHFLAKQFTLLTTSRWKDEKNE
ncbi:TetR-like C-terminal domain-containing protein [Paenibacillus sp. sgz500958]|uniref:TetR-like C-terminal domain-containing protein n=1 Tax=Paenibacillus sp. sgz500958 TaxID=3242475 RepID=UPI0036D43173